MHKNIVYLVVDSLRTACVRAVETTRFFVDSLWVKNFTTFTCAPAFQVQQTALSTTSLVQITTVKNRFYTPSPALIKTTNKLLERYL